VHFRKKVPVLWFLCCPWGYLEEENVSCSFFLILFASAKSTKFVHSRRHVRGVPDLSRDFLLGFQTSDASNCGMLLPRKRGESVNGFISWIYRLFLPPLCLCRKSQSHTQSVSWHVSCGCEINEVTPSVRLLEVFAFGVRILHLESLEMRHPTCYIMFSRVSRLVYKDVQSVRC